LVSLQTLDSNRSGATTQMPLGTLSVTLVDSFWTAQAAMFLSVYGLKQWKAQ